MSAPSNSSDRSAPIAERYPLYWPTGQPRARSRRDSAFKIGFASSRDKLFAELRMLGGRNVILSTNIPLRLDGLPYAHTAEPNDPGVAVYFDRTVGNARRDFVIACDTYRKVAENLRAVGVTVEALRTIQRHGATSMLEQAFAGFAALPPANHAKPWAEVLGVASGATREDIERAYRELAKVHHPDVGGDTERMAQINRARVDAITEVEKR
ncbi:MAG: J domain-containing protein [Polyangiales bacterium]